MRRLGTLICSQNTRPHLIVVDSGDTSKYLTLAIVCSEFLLSRATISKLTVQLQLFLTTEINAFVQPCRSCLVKIT
jgi:hypothetical protein